MLSFLDLPPEIRNQIYRDIYEQCSVEQQPVDPHFSPVYKITCRDAAYPYKVEYRTNPIEHETEPVEDKNDPIEDEKDAAVEDKKDIAVEYLAYLTPPISPHLSLMLSCTQVFAEFNAFLPRRNRRLRIHLCSNPCPAVICATWMGPLSYRRKTDAIFGGQEKSEFNLDVELVFARPFANVLSESVPGKSYVNSNIFGSIVALLLLYCERNPAFFDNVTFSSDIFRPWGVPDARNNRGNGGITIRTNQTGSFRRIRHQFTDLFRHVVKRGVFAGMVGCFRLSDRPDEDYVFWERIPVKGVQPPSSSLATDTPYRDKELKKVDLKEAISDIRKRSLPKPIDDYVVNTLHQKDVLDLATCSIHEDRSDMRGGRSIQYQRVDSFRKVGGPDRQKHGFNSDDSYGGYWVRLAWLSDSGED